MSWDLGPEDDSSYVCSRCGEKLCVTDFLYSDLCVNCEERRDEVPKHIPSSQVDKYIDMKLKKGKE